MSIQIITAVACVFAITAVALHRWWRVKFMTHLMQSGAISGNSQAKRHWQVLRDVVWLGINTDIAAAHEMSRKRAYFKATVKAALMRHRLFNRCFGRLVGEPSPEVAIESHTVAKMAQPQFEAWLGLWEESRSETDALLAFLKRQGAPWLVAKIIMRTYYSVYFHVDPKERVLCSTVKVAGLSTHSKYVDGAQNVLELPLPGMRIRNLARFNIKHDVIYAHGEIAIVGGSTLSANVTVISRNPATDEIELKTIDQKNGTYSRFLRRKPK